MFAKALFGAVAVLAGSAVVAYGAGKEDVEAAVKKLAAADSYSWRSTTEAASGFGNGTTEGKTQKDGLTVTKGTFGDNEIVTVRKGDKFAMKRGDQDWVSSAEMAQRGGGRGRGMFGGGGQTPAAMAEQWLQTIPDFKESGGAYVAELSGDAVRNMMPFGRGRGGQGGQGPEITNGKATVKVWIKDGMISKTELTMAGSINFNGNDVDLGRTTTTEIKDVNKTKVEVPAEAKAKLQE